MQKREILKLILFNILVLIVFCILVEVSVRVLFPEVIFLRFDRNFFAEKRYGVSFSFKPNIEGFIWGRKFKTDRFGFPLVSERPIKESDAKILILGDSISFPVGVDTKEGFPYLLERCLENYRIINASITGYWFGDYFNVLNKLIRRVNFEGIVVSVCLNDSVDLSQVSIKKDITYDRDRLRDIMKQNPFKRFMMNIGYSNFLMQHSKTYVLLKNILFDSSKLFFAADMLEYDKPNKEDFITRNLREINDLAAKNGKWLIFFVFPYRAQFSASDNDMKAQEMFKRIAKNHSLCLVDMYPLIKERIQESNIHPEELYLKFDPMHFSAKGHRIIADIIDDKLQELILAKGKNKE